MKRLEQYDVYELPVADIFYDAGFNCRGSFTPQSVHDLSESIKENGLQFPVVVQPCDTAAYKYRLLAGHRRFKAVTLFLKWSSIPAPVRSELTEHQVRLLNLTENLERKDLNMLEEAKAIHNLYPAGVSLRKASKELKRPTRWIHARLRLLDLPQEVQKWAAAGGLKFLAEYAMGYEPKYHYEDVEPPKSWYPVERGYAPFALAISSPEKNWEVWGYDKKKEEPKLEGHAWPACIDRFIDWWGTKEDARDYARDDVVYTRALDRHFGNPEPNDDDSMLSIMVPIIRWRGFRIDVAGMKALRDKTAEKVRQSVESFRPEVPLIGMTWNEAQENWAEKKGGSVTVTISAPEMQ